MKKATKSVPVLAGISRTTKLKIEIFDYHICVAKTRAASAMFDGWLSSTPVGLVFWMLILSRRNINTYNHRFGLDDHSSAPLSPSSSVLVPPSWK